MAISCDFALYLLLNPNPSCYRRNATGCFFFGAFVHRGCATKNCWFLLDNVVTPVIGRPFCYCGISVWSFSVLLYFYRFFSQPLILSFYRLSANPSWFSIRTVQTFWNIMLKLYGHLLVNAWKVLVQCKAVKILVTKLVSLMSNVDVLYWYFDARIQLLMLWQLAKHPEGKLTLRSILHITTKLVKLVFKRSNRFGIQLSALVPLCLRTLQEIFMDRFILTAAVGPAPPRVACTAHS